MRTTRIALTLSLALQAHAWTAFAAPPAPALYADAIAQERAVRDAMNGQEQGQTAVLKAVRTVVNRFESVVRHYPTSGYSDDALWHGGQLASDAFRLFKQPGDRDTAVRLLRGLVTGYPASKYARLAPDIVARLSGEAPPGAVPSVEEIPVVQRAASAPVAQLAVMPDRIQAAPAVARVRPGTHIGTITNIRRSVLPEIVRVVIETDQEIPLFHEERLAGPDRVFLDLGSTRAGAGLLDQTLRFDSDSDPVRQIRIGRQPNNTTRVVLDATDITSYSVYALYQPFRLVVECVRARPALPPPPPALATRRLGSGALAMATALPSAGAVLNEARRANPPATPPAAPPPMTPALRTPEPAPAPTMAPEPAVRNLAGGFSISRQLGLGVSRVVIDPGHGGHDPGASGGDVNEAELVLDIALRLQTLLSREPGVEAVLTRRSDEFVPLEERTAIANRENADLFLSIHANASPNRQARGIETYFLNFANNLDAAAVAARENAASGQAMAALPDLVKSIALHNKLDESRDFATLVQRSMLERVRGANKSVKDLGVKQAPFVVLIGAAMPSVLTEISFVTNSQEAKLLRTSAYRQRIAEALVSAIRTYQKGLSSVGTMAKKP